MQQVSCPLPLLHLHQHHLVYLGGLDVAVEFPHHVHQLVPVLTRHHFLFLQVQDVLRETLVLIAQSLVLELKSLNLFLLFEHDLGHFS